MEVPGAAEGVRAALGREVCWSPMEGLSNTLGEGVMGEARPPAGLGRTVWSSLTESFDIELGCGAVDFSGRDGRRC